MSPAKRCERTVNIAVYFATVSRCICRAVLFVKENLPASRVPRHPAKLDNIHAETLVIEIENKSVI